VKFGIDVSDVKPKVAVVEPAGSILSIGVNGKIVPSLVSQHDTYRTARPIFTIKKSNNSTTRNDNRQCFRGLVSNDFTNYTQASKILKKPLSSAKIPAKPITPNKLLMVKSGSGNRTVTCSSGFEGPYSRRPSLQPFSSDNKLAITFKEV
jgi:hypothetical protein